MKLREFRMLLRKLIKEELGNASRPTVPAKHSAAEKELAAKHPKWGADQGEERGESSKALQGMANNSPVNVKAKQVATILKNKGRDNDAKGAKLITQQLVPFLQEFDPQELFIMGPEDLADEFEKKYFH